MPFVYVHVAGFAAWMFFLERNRGQRSPLVGPLEANFLSAFVLLIRDIRGRLVALDARLPAAGDQGPAEALTGAPVGHGHNE